MNNLSSSRKAAPQNGRAQRPALANTTNTPSPRPRTPGSGPQRGGPAARPGAQMGNRHRASSNVPQRARSQTTDDDQDQEQENPDDDDDEEEDEQVHVGMKRKRTSGKKAAEMVAIEQSQSAADLAELQKIGRIYGRMYVPFSSLDIVIHWGAVAEENGIHTLKKTPRRYAQEWDALVEAYPRLRDLIHKMGKDFVVEKLHRYRRDTRGEDVLRIKDEILKWRKWQPAFTVDEAEDKTRRGLNQPQMAKLLLPRDHTGPLPATTFKFSAHVTPRLLYPDDDPLEDNGPGLFKSSIIVQGAQAVLLGPKAVLRPTRRPATNSVTVLYKVKFVTFVFLAYITCIVRYALSAEAEFTPDGQQGFNYISFFKYILGLVSDIDDLGEAGQKITSGILEWCEGQIWGDDHGLDDDVEEGPQNDKEAVLAKYRQWVAEQDQGAA